MNIGISESSLNWEVAELPDWGIWTLNPNNGNDLTPEMGEVEVNISIEIPDEKNKEFIGDLKIINRDKTDDYCGITISIATVKNQRSLTSRYPLFFDNFFRKNNFIECIHLLLYKN